MCRCKFSGHLWRSRCRAVWINHKPQLQLQFLHKRTSTYQEISDSPCTELSAFLYDVHVLVWLISVFFSAGGSKNHVEYTGQSFWGSTHFFMVQKILILIPKLCHLKWKYYPKYVSVEPSVGQLANVTSSCPNILFKSFEKYCSAVDCNKSIEFTHYLVASCTIFRHTSKLYSWLFTEQKNAKTGCHVVSKYCCRNYQRLEWWCNNFHLI